MSRRLSSASEYSRLTRQPPSRSMATSLRPSSRRGVAGVVDVGVLAIQHLAHHGAERELVDGDAAAERAADHVDHRNTVTESRSGELEVL